MSAFEDLMSMKLAFLVKDIDPQSYKDCLGPEVLQLSCLNRNQ